jgi:hypothetical protein
MKGVRSGTHTGWFGRYEYRGKSGVRHFATATHVVENGVPVCGVILHPDMEFQWCGSGIVREYVECRNCQRVLRARVTFPKRNQARATGG